MLKCGFKDGEYFLWLVKSYLVCIKVENGWSLIIYLEKMINTIYSPAEKLVNARNPYGVYEKDFLIPQTGKFIIL